MMSRYLWNIIDPAVSYRNGRWREKVPLWRRLLGLAKAKEGKCDQPKPTSGEWTAEALARQFHELYESYACEFAYETRQETRAFNPTTPNGRLMIAVCKEIADAHKAALTAAIKEARREIINEFEEQAWHDGTMSPDVRLTFENIRAAAQKPLIDAVFPKGTEDGEPTVQEAVKAIKETRGDLSEAMKQLRETAAAQKPLVDALTKARKELGCVSIDAISRDIDGALAKVKETT